MLKKALCFYHATDLDGKCSAALVKIAHKDSELFPIDYGEKFPWHLLRPEPLSDADKIFMVDFSLEPFEQMIKLQRLSDNKLVWIDHHKSAIEAHKDWNHNHSEYLSINGLRRIGIGACYLVWEYLKKHLPADPSPQEAPLFIRLLAEYDVWNHTDIRTLPFQYGMRLYEADPENVELWLNLWNDSECEKIVKEGQTILKFVEQDNAKYAKGTCFETSLDGLKCLAINRAYGNSGLFSCMDTSGYDAMLSFAWHKDRWVVRLFSNREDLDVSSIAKKRGGGGHKDAAGFTCQKLPFRLQGKYELENNKEA